MYRRDFLKHSSLGFTGLFFDQGLTIAQVRTQIQTRGAYSSPQSFWAKGLRLDEYGINAIFVHSGSIDPSMIQRARSESAKIFAEFAGLSSIKSERPDTTMAREDRGGKSIGPCEVELYFGRGKRDAGPDREKVIL
jgi:hypothetical protein